MGLTGVGLIIVEDAQDIFSSVGVTFSLHILNKSSDINDSRQHTGNCSVIDLITIISHETFTIVSVKRL